FCLTGKEAKELARLARENNVFLMEVFKYYSSNLQVSGHGFGTGSLGVVP
ncbi:unnamed protein product, partial [Allacma fusca]